MSDGDDGLDPVRALLPGERLELVATLKSGERSTVRRFEAATDDGRRSLVVKEYHTDGDGWLRESAALASVPGSVRVSAVIAVGVDPRLLVLEDLGDGAGVGAALAAGDPAVAREALFGWADALAELHIATRSARERFRTALAERRGAIGADEASEVAESWMPSRLREAERALDRHCGALGVTIPAGALDELTSLVTRLGGDGPAALTPADACPDNNVRVGDRVVLLDFEGAQWRHLAWDVAYLLVPWPTCPHAWRIPDELAAQAVDRYRADALPAFPEVGTDEFSSDVDAAVAGWAAISASWWLDTALNDGAAHGPEDTAGPGRRALVLHRLQLAAHTTALPALAELCGALWQRLHDAWGDVPLALAPAFRD